MLASCRAVVLSALVLCFMSTPVQATEPQDNYDLAGSVGRALTENFTVVGAQAGSMAAEEQRKAVRGSFGPALGSSYGYQKYQHKHISSGKEQDDDLYAWTVWLRQNVFSGFSTLSNYQKSILQKENADAGHDKTRLALIATVQENFFLLLQARENVRSVKDALERLRSQLKATRAFHDVGLKPRLDVLQAEVDVATSENLLLQANNIYETQLARLNTLLVLPVGSPVRYTGSLAYIPFTMELDQCLATAYKKRPDLRMAVKSVAMAGKDITIARSGMYPNINAEAAWATQGDRATVSGSTLKPQGFSEWRVGVTGEWTAFQWGTTHYSVQQAKMIQQRMKADENNLRQEIAFEVKSRLLKISEAAKRIKVAQKGLEQSREAYRLAGARYQSQVGIFLDVLDAQAKLTSAEAALTAAQVDHMIALAHLYAAMGEENTSLSAIK